MKENMQPNLSNQAKNSESYSNPDVAAEQGRMMELFIKEDSKRREDFRNIKENPTAEDYEEASQFIDELIQEAEDESSLEKIAYSLGRLAFVPPAVLLLVLTSIGEMGTGSDLLSRTVGGKLKKVRESLMDASEALKLMKKSANK